MQIQGTTGNDQSEWSNLTVFTAEVPTPNFDVVPMSRSAYVLVSENTIPYEISYRPAGAGDDEWTSVTTSDKLPKIEGLIADTEYEVRLRNIIGEYTSAWTTTRTFTTAALSGYADVNCDDNISIADITAIVNIMKGNTTGYNVDEADMNYDGMVDEKDIKFLIKMLFSYFLK